MPACLWLLFSFFSALSFGKSFLPSFHGWHTFFAHKAEKSARLFPSNGLFDGDEKEKVIRQVPFCVFHLWLRSPATILGILGISAGLSFKKEKRGKRKWRKGLSFYFGIFIFLSWKFSFRLWKIFALKFRFLFLRLAKFCLLFQLRKIFISGSFSAA